MLADTPSNWPDPQPTSTLHVLLLFAGIPLLVIIVVSVLVMAPSMARGPRYRPDQEWDADSEQFGTKPLGQSVVPAGQIESSGATPAHREQATTATRKRLAGDDDDAGGASAGW
jgi:hypothetical protein